MTKDRAAKRAARGHAQDSGIPYAKARRETRASNADHAAAAPWGPRGRIAGRLSRVFTMTVGTNYGNAMLWQGTAGQVTRTIALLEDITGWPTLEILASKSTSWTKLQGLFLEAFSTRFGPGRVPGRSRDEQVHHLRHSVRFNLVLRDAHHLTPQAALYLTSWIKAPPHGMAVITGPDAGEVVGRDKHGLLPSYVTVLELGG